MSQKWCSFCDQFSWSVQLTFEVMGLSSRWQVSPLFVLLSFLLSCLFLCFLLVRSQSRSLHCLHYFFFLKYKLTVSLLPYRVRGLCNGKSSFFREQWWRDDWHALWSCRGYKDDVEYYIVFSNFDISSSLTRETQSYDSNHEYTLLCPYQREKNSCVSVSVLVHDSTVSTVMTWNTF